MNVKTWIPLGLAVVLGLVAAKLVRDSMSRGHGEARSEKVTATVTAARDIEPGQKLSAADLATGKVAVGTEPTGSFQTPAELIDRVATTRLVKGQMVLDSLLAPVGTAAGVQALIPQGMRAITLQVNEFSGVGGLLAPGCKVDVISVIRNEGTDGTVARTIVQNVEVRAVGRQVSAAGLAQKDVADAPAAGAPPAPLANSVTLLVTPEQAEAVQLATVGGAPWLVLRNGKDAQAVTTGGTTLADLRGASHKQNPVEPETTPVTKLTKDPFANDGEKPESSAAAIRTRTVNIIRATKEERMTVDVRPVPPGNFTSTKTDEGDATGRD